MDGELRSDISDKLTLGTIVHFNLNDTIEIGVVYASKSSHNAYLVKYISTDPKEQGKLSEIRLRREDIEKTHFLINKEQLGRNKVIYDSLIQIYKSESENMAQSRSSHARMTSSRATSSRKSPTRMTPRMTPRMTQRINTSNGGSRKKRRNRRYKK
jgi:hypothetical protein